MKRWYWQLVKVFWSGAVIAVCTTLPSWAQKAKPVKVLFMLDGSSSMLDDWQPGVQRFSAASKLINTIVDSVQRVNPNVEFALRVFGHRYTVQQNNCTDTKLEVPFAVRNQEQIKARLKNISPRGVSPIAYSLEKTADENFTNTNDNAYSIILLTDGGESCGGNICTVIETLMAGKIAFRPYILSLIEDEGLKKGYDCFGKYLTVAAPSQVEMAIKTIIDDNRLMYEKNDGSLAVTKHEPVTQTPIVVPVIPKPQEVVKPKEVPVVVETPKVSVQRTPLVFLSQTKVSKIKGIPYKSVQLRKNNRAAVPFKSGVLFTAHEEPAVIVRAKAVKVGAKPGKINWAMIRVIPDLPLIKKQAPWNPNVLFTPADPKPVVIATPPPPAPKPQPKPTSPPKAVTSPSKLAAESPILEVTEKSEDTKVMVYFTDGKGKYYKTEPKLDFVDVKTNKVVHSAFRLVNRQSGIPDPIKIPPGTYRITRPNSSFRSAVVTIAENTTKRVDITIAKGSIKFRYAGNPNRPMVEYFATVHNSVERGPVTRQRCDELLEYEPGIYHIEINTLPVMVRTLPDLKFGELNLIDVPEPGTVNVSNGFTGRVQFWYRRGASFEPFHDMSLNGNPAEQVLNLQPGPYKIYFFKDGEERVKDFQVKSNAVTSITL